MRLVNYYPTKNMETIYLNQSISYLSEEEKKKSKELKRPNALIDYLQLLDNVYGNSKDYNLIKKEMCL